MSDERGVKGSKGPDLTLPAYNELRMQMKHLVTCYGFDVVARMLAIRAGETAALYGDEKAHETARVADLCAGRLELFDHRRRR